MLYEIVNGKAVRAEADDAQSNGRQCFGFFDIEKSMTVFQGTNLSQPHLANLLDNESMTFENHDGFDIIRVNLTTHTAHFTRSDRICICVLENKTLFFSRDISRFEKLIQDILDGSASMSYERLLSTFFERITANDTAYLEKLEQEISTLEDALITSRNSNCVTDIIALRKRLLNLKRYYEQLLNVLDELLENENELMSERSLRYFRIYDGKADRLYHNILNLRDYVTQVREAYQAEVDISLNNIMKIFTVITAIFLPLTLIVGWYGMNLQMPEFHWPYAYPVVIALSVAVVVFCLVYFKKHKWF